MHTIVGYGASTMAVAGDSQGGFLKRVERAMPGMQLLNHGIGGNSLQHMLERVDKLPPGGSYDLIVLLGCNDLPRANDAWPGNRSTLPQYTDRLHRLLSTIKGRRSLFVSSFAVSEEKTGVSAVLFDSYMASALRMAGELGYEIWDLYRESQAVAHTYWAPDGLHFGDAGHQYIADGVIERIRGWR